MDIQHDNGVEKEAIYDPFSQEEYGKKTWVGTRKEHTVTKNEYYTFGLFMCKMAFF